MSNYIDFVDLYQSVVLKEEKAFLSKYLKKISFDNVRSMASGLYILEDDSVYVSSNLGGYRTTEKYISIIYFSKEINEYRLVFLRGDIVKKGYYKETNPGRYILITYDTIVTVGEIELSVSSPINRDFLDIYYNSFYSSNDVRIHISELDDQIYYQSYPTELDRMFVAATTETYKVKFAYEDIYSSKFYYTDEDNLGIINYSLDNPSDILVREDYYVDTNNKKINYNFYQYFKVADETKPSVYASMTKLDIYTSMESIYNILNDLFYSKLNRDQVNLITINNEYTLICSLKNNYLQNRSLYLLNGLDYNQLYKIETPINGSYYDIVFTPDINYSSNLYSTKFNEYVDTVTDMVSGMTELYSGNDRKSLNNDFSSIILNYENFNKTYTEYDGYPSILQDDIRFNNQGNLSDIIQYYHQDPATDCIYLNIQRIKVGYPYIIIARTDNIIYNKELIYDSMFSADAIFIYDNILLGSINKDAPYDSRKIVAESSQDNVEFINTISTVTKKFIGSITSNTIFETFPTKEEIDSVQGFTQYRDISYKLDYNVKIDKDIISNEYITNDRFKIYGCAIDIYLSDPNYVSYISNFNSLINFVNSGKIVVKPYIYPMYIDKQNNYNILPTLTLEKINSHFQLDNYVNSTFLSDNGIDSISPKDDIMNYVVNSGEINEIDKNLYVTFNEGSMTYNFAEMSSYLGLENTTSPIFLIHDTFTNLNYLQMFDYKSSIINNETNMKYHYTHHLYGYITGGRYKSYNFYVKEGEQFETETIDFYGGVKLQNRYPDFIYSIYLKNITINNYNSLNGEILKFIISGDVFNTTSFSTYYVEVEVDSTDFIIINNSLIIDIESILSADERFLSSMSIHHIYKKQYKTYSYVDFYNITINSNVSHISEYITYRVTATFIEMHETENDLVNLSYINIEPNSIPDLLPQVFYNKQLYLSMFDINENPFDLFADNKSCAICQNFINNSTDNLTISDITSIDTTSVVVFDKNLFSYDNFEDLTKVKPIFLIDNVDKYCKCYINVELDPTSVSLFDTFDLVNMYNLEYADSTSGSLILEGKISDYTSGMVFDEMLKIYQTELLFTISHNVNNSINVPLYTNITAKIYDNYSDFTSNIDSTEYTLSDVIIARIKNRGEDLIIDQTYYPKFTSLIEYYEIYPEFDLQEEKEYITTLEMSIKSNNPEYVKVSELFFDVIHGTDDLLVGIPVDYTTSPDPEHEKTNVDWVTVNDKREVILEYFNLLIRNKCPNCTILKVLLQVKLKPNLYGFNIAGFMIGCYEYNISFEFKLPSIFYKKSADAVFILQEDVSFNNDSTTYSDNICNEFLNSQSETNKLALKYIDIESAVDIKTRYKKRLITNSVKTLLTFNSSVHTKIVKFNLIKNDSPKYIHNTDFTFTLAPLEVRILQLNENIYKDDYTDTYNSGLAFYDMIQIDTETDETTFISTVELVIPSIDEYVTDMLDLVSGTTQEMDITFVNNEYPVKVNLTPDRSKYKRDRLKMLRITENDVSYLNYKESAGVMDIDYNFTVNRLYSVNISKDILADVLYRFEDAPSTFFIKIPINTKKVEVGINSSAAKLLLKRYIEYASVSNVLAHILVDSTGVDYHINNFVDDNQLYAYLIGKRVDLLELRFELKFNISFSNNDIYGILLNNLLYNFEDTSMLTFLGIKVNLSSFSIESLLNKLFLSTSSNEVEYIFNKFIKNQYSSELNEVISETVGFLTVDVDELSGSSFANKFITTSKIEFSNINISVNPLACIRSIENAKYNRTTSYISDPYYPKKNTLSEKDITIIKNDNVYQDAKNSSVVGNYMLGFPGPDDPPCEILESFNGIISYMDDGTKLLTDKNVKSLNYYNLTFEEIYNTLYSNNILSNIFSSDGVYELYFPIGETWSGISRKHNLSIEIDGSQDVILSTRIITNKYNYFINANNENSLVVDKNFAREDDTPANMLVLTTSTLKLDNIIFYSKNSTILQVEQIKDDKFVEKKYATLSYSMVNKNYALYKILLEKIRQKPLTVALLEDYSKTPIRIVEDTNYKMLMEVPVIIYKLSESHLVINKIKISDDFLTSCDYCILFGDENDRHIIKSNTTEKLNKTYYKYNNALKFLIRTFNVPSSSGEFNSSILIYYTFNGVESVLDINLRYSIVLPKVLDNEYLLLKTDRIDKPENFESIEETKDMLKKTGTSDTNLSLLWNIDNGAKGCVISYCTDKTAAISIRSKSLSGLHPDLIFDLDK